MQYNYRYQLRLLYETSSFPSNNNAYFVYGGARVASRNDESPFLVECAAGQDRGLGERRHRGPGVCREVVAAALGVEVAGVGTLAAA